MIDIIIRPLALADISILVEIDHSYHTDYVWQMDLNTAESEVNVIFREVRLPRSMRVEYPRDHSLLFEDWQNRPGLLVAELKDQPVGYIGLTDGIVPGMTMVTDLVVKRRFRRQGVGMALIRGAQTWAAQQNVNRLILEMQSKNYPAICVAQKIGYEFCGYNDMYFSNQDIALFFVKRL